MEHQDYMEQALALAREAAAHGEVPVGCVIVHRGQIIGRGRNRREEKQAVYSHAEMEAVAANTRQRYGPAAARRHPAAFLHTPVWPVIDWCGR